MQPFLDQVSQLLSGYLPKLLGALAILVIGWLLAFIASALVRGMLKRTTLDKTLATWVVGKEAAKNLQVERWVSKGVYYLILVFVLIMFLQTLNLTIATEPLNRLLNRLFGFLPQILGGAALLAIAWVVATVLSKLVARGLDAARIDERLGGRAGMVDPKGAPLSKTLSDAIYWLVFLLFLPAVLGALQLEGLLDPVRNLTNQIFSFLPNLLAAGLVLVVGWFVARIVQQIVTNLLAAVGLDALGDRLGLGSSLGSRKLSGLLGLIAYILILIPVVITSLNALELHAIAGPATSMLGQVMEAIPSIFAAVLLLGLAYLVGRLLAGLVTSLLTGAGFNTVLNRLGLSREGARAEPSPAEVAGYLTLVVIMLFAAIEAARLLGFQALATLVSGFTVFVGQLILGLVVLGVGLYLANLVAETIRTSSAPQAPLLALVARVSIIVLAGAIGLNQMGLANEIISLAFGIVLGSVAVAVALAFGLGGRDLAARRLQAWMESVEKRR